MSEPALRSSGDELPGVPGPSETGDSDPAPSSLLSLQIRRRRPPNGGWTRGSRLAATPANPLARPLAKPPEDRPRRPSAFQDSKPAARSDARSDDGIYRYWRDHRGGRDYPAWSDLDPDEILARWPDSVLLSCDRHRPLPTLEASFAEALRDAKRRRAERLEPVVEYTPLLTEWLLTIGRAVARIGKPLNDTEHFPSYKGRIRYQVVGLPLGTPDSGVEHVLCHVTRT